MKRQLSTLQLGRAFGAIAVLLYHTHVTLALPKYLGREVYRAFYAGDSGVHYFFVLSGFVILLVHQKDIGQPRRVAAFFWKRFRRVYPPLWIVLAGLLPVFFLVPSFGKGGETAPSTILAAFLASPFEQERLLGPEWTLRHEVLFYLLFGLVIAKPRLGAVLAAVWLGGSIMSPWLGLSYPWSFFFSDYHALFLFGALAGIADNRGLHRYPVLLFGVGAVLFAGTWTLVCLGLLHKDWSSNWGFGVGALGLILGAAGLERRVELRVPRALTFLGDASYSIYLVNFPAISLACKAVVKLDGRVPDAVLFSMTASFALCAGIGFHLIFEKPALNLLSRVPWGRAPAALADQPPAVNSPVPVVITSDHAAK